MERPSSEAARHAVEAATSRSFTHGAWLSSAGIDGSRGLGEFFAAVAGRDLVAFDVPTTGRCPRSRNGHSMTSIFGALPTVKQKSLFRGPVLP